LSGAALFSVHEIGSETEHMAFEDELAAALDLLPQDALERILKAAEKSNLAGEKVLAEELADDLNRLTDMMPDLAILERLPEAMRDDFKAHLEAKLPDHLNMSDLVRTRLTLRALCAWLADQRDRANQELVLEVARKRIAERRERMRLGLPLDEPARQISAEAPPLVVAGNNTPAGFRSEAYRMPRGAVPEVNPRDAWPPPSAEAGSEEDSWEFWRNRNQRRRGL
jgi:hypothetical protein